MELEEKRILEDLASFNETEVFRATRKIAKRLFANDKLAYKVAKFGLREWNFEHTAFVYAMENFAESIAKTDGLLIVFDLYKTWTERTLPPAFHFKVPSSWSRESLEATLLYFAVYQTASVVRSLGSHCFWLLYHLCLVSHFKQQDHLPIEDSSFLHFELCHLTENYDPIGTSVVFLDRELDAFLHLVYDRTVLNRFSIQHSDFDYLAITPEFVDLISEWWFCGQRSFVRVFISNQTRYPYLSAFFDLRRAGGEVVSVDPTTIRNAAPREKKNFNGKLIFPNEDARKKWDVLVTSCFDSLPENHILHKSSPEDVWKGICKEANRLIDDWKVHRDMNGGLLGIYGYITILSQIWPVILYNVVLICFAAWWVFGYKLDFYLFVYGGVILLAILLCLALRWLWVPIFRKKINALGPKPVYAPLICDPTPNSVGAEVHDRSIFWLLLIWIATTGTMVIIFNFLGMAHMRKATLDLTHRAFSDSPFLALLRLFLHWFPTVIILVLLVQFVFLVWQSIFSMIFGYGMGLGNIKWWSDVTVTSVTEAVITVIDKTCSNLTDIRDRHIAGMILWNHFLADMYISDMISQKELKSLKFTLVPIENEEEAPDTPWMFRKVVFQWPDFKKNRPVARRARETIYEFLNTCLMGTIPNSGSVAALPIMSRAIPVGGSEPIYPSWNELLRSRNTDTSLMRHLLLLYAPEFEHFCYRNYPKENNERSESSGPSEDYEMENTVEKNDTQTTPDSDLSDLGKLHMQFMRAVLNRRKKIPVIPESARRPIQMWAGRRAVCTYRNLITNIRVNQCVQLLARFQDPCASCEDIATLVRSKVRLVVGFQGYQELKQPPPLYDDNDNGSLEVLLKSLDTALIVFPDPDLDFDCDYVLENVSPKEFPRCGKFSFVYQWQDPATRLFYAKEIDSLHQKGILGPSIPGPFSTVGFGKPWNQNFMSTYLCSTDVVQTLDVNQEVNCGQGYMLPAVLQKFVDDPNMHLLAATDSVMNLDWNIVAFASSLSQRAFASISQRMMSLEGVRYHYGHSDFLRTRWLVGASGLSRANILSEDVTLGFDVALRGGRIGFIDYYQLGKAKDTDVLAVTKFERKIAGGNPQLSCCSMQWELMFAPFYCGWYWRNPVRGFGNLLRRMSMYYNLTGWYLTHTVLCASIFVLAFCIVLLIILDWIDTISGYSYELARTWVYINVGIILFIPGFLQFVLDKGWWKGTIRYFIRFIPLALNGIFHIIDTAQYFNQATRIAPVYRFSGRGDGLSHVGFRIIWDNFQWSHYPLGFYLFYAGIIMLVDKKILLFIVVVLIPAGVWMWGAMLMDMGTIGYDLSFRAWINLFLRDSLEYFAVIRRFYLSSWKKLKQLALKGTWKQKPLIPVFALFYAFWTVFLALNLWHVVIVPYLFGAVVMGCRQAWRPFHWLFVKIRGAKKEEVELTLEEEELAAPERPESSISIEQGDVNAVPQFRLNFAALLDDVMAQSTRRESLCAGDTRRGIVDNSNKLPDERISENVRINDLAGRLAMRKKVSGDESVRVQTARPMNPINLQILENLEPKSRSEMTFANKDLEYARARRKERAKQPFSPRETRDIAGKRGSLPYPGREDSPRHRKSIPNLEDVKDFLRNLHPSTEDREKLVEQPASEIAAARPSYPYNEMEEANDMNRQAFEPVAASPLHIRKLQLASITPAMLAKPETYAAAETRRNRAASDANNEFVQIPQFISPQRGSTARRGSEAPTPVQQEQLAAPASPVPARRMVLPDSARGEARRQSLSARPEAITDEDAVARANARRKLLHNPDKMREAMKGKASQDLFRNISEVRLKALRARTNMAKSPLSKQPSEEPQEKMAIHTGGGELLSSAPSESYSESFSSGGLGSRSGSHFYEDSVPVKFASVEAAGDSLSSDESSDESSDDGTGSRVVVEIHDRNDSKMQEEEDETYLM